MPSAVAAPGGATAQAVSSWMTLTGAFDRAAAATLERTARALFGILGDRWLVALQEFVRRDLRRIHAEGVTRVDVERTIQSPLPAVPALVIEGRLDRILRSDEKVSIDDYKTGGNIKTKLSPARVLKGLDIQLPLYREVVAGVRAVQEGRIDATVCAVGMGAIAEADALVGVRFLHQSMDPKMVKEGQRAMSGCYTTIQKGGLPGVPEDTPLWSAPLANIATTRMPDHVAYKLVETWWNNYKDYQPIHPVLRFWTPKVFTNIHFTQPYHNGAIKFYKEKGVWTPEMEAKQKRLLSGE